MILKAYNDKHESIEIGEEIETLGEVYYILKIELTAAGFIKDIYAINRDLNKIIKVATNLDGFKKTDEISKDVVKFAEAMAGV